MPNNSLTVEDPEAQRLINLSYVANTEKNTSKWLRHVDQYREEKNITKMLDQFDNKEELDVFLCSFISWLTKKDGTPFKVESIHNCYAALARYLRENSAVEGGIRIWDKYSFPRALRCLDSKMKSLQNNSYGDTSKSDLLTSNEIISCLNHNYLSVNDNKEIKNDIWYKASRMGENKLKSMMQQIVINIGIDLEGRKITNHSCRRTAIMILKAFDVPEDEVMIFSGHRSCKDIHAYSSPTDDQRLLSMALLILYTSYNKDLESYYSFPRNSYIDYNSDENDKMETSSTLDLSQEVSNISKLPPQQDILNTISKTTQN
ncbi:21085_t:CDS:2 [Cetraspora pellucida]|uniref:21085_t:CDS:1 n=1 Tax=Cetraspora pellucida TaxID=1433469 RepID=A0A9N9NGV5_9GLOM|nr:21085_t:CDS:2 [Cetraspora pellucida]